MEVAYCPYLGKLVEAQSVKNGHDSLRHYRYVCPECREPVRYRDWSNSRPYFAHAKFNPDCTMSESGSWSMAPGEESSVGGIVISGNGRSTSRQYDAAKSERSRLIQKLKRGSENGDSDASLKLGRLFEEEEDFEQARKFFLQAYQQGVKEAIVPAYECAYKVSKGSSQTRDLLLKASELGYSDATYLLAMSYRQAGDFVNSEKYLIEAVDKGSLEAMYTYGIMYLKGESTVYGLECLERASDAGHRDSTEVLASYYKNLKSEDSYRLYSKYLLRLMDTEDPYTLAEIGDMYIRGMGIRKDEEKAFEYYSKAALQRPDLWITLLNRYSKSDNEESVRFAVRCYSEIVKLDLSDEKNQSLKDALSDKELVATISRMFLNLAEKQTDPKMAEDYYTLGSEAGSFIDKKQGTIPMDTRECMIRLAEIRLEEGRESDAMELFMEAKGYKTAIELYYGGAMIPNTNVDGFLYQLREMAMKGSAKAQFCLGRLYLEGNGIKQSNYLARNWLTIAAKKDPKAEAMLSEMGKGVETQPENYDDFKKWNKIRSKIKKVN